MPAPARPLAESPPFDDQTCRVGGNHHVPARRRPRRLTSAVQSARDPWTKAAAFLLALPPATTAGSRPVLRRADLGSRRRRPGRVQHQRATAVSRDQPGLSPARNRGRGRLQPHRAALASTAVVGVVLAALRIAAHAGQRLWAVEGCNGIGAQALPALDQFAPRVRRVGGAPLGGRTSRVDNMFMSTVRCAYLHARWSSREVFGVGGGVVFGFGQ
jgi:hypothetical protein